VQATRSRSTVQQKLVAHIASCRVLSAGSGLATNSEQLHAAGSALERGLTTLVVIVTLLFGGFVFLRSLLFNLGRIAALLELHR
jgi:hypothetical protein